MSDSPLDGNVLAGALREIFAVDLTIAAGTCAGCGQVSVLAESVVFARAPGMIARCRHCQSILLRLVAGPGRSWLDLRGLRVIEIPAHPPSAPAALTTPPN